ncbi:iron-sulfur cluster assembly scaffold protein [Sphingomonas bacterium]|uniref:iron-sulfur cluster assembly scaffold protein n=1 Tax=Sphingomonas bacterium TaxID=1895847 RepID=UPI0015775E06|nr:iron-sulfur cluster assembly scaffold protein [Sphingomonas bacterium]
MSAPLYNAEILRLAASIPHHERLPDPMGSAERRSPICGSRVTVDVDTDGDGRIEQVGLLVRACALGQASSSLLAANMIGRTPAELAAASEALTAWLAGGEDVPDWPGIAIFAPALSVTGRHASIRLAFEAAAEAAAQARDRARSPAAE